MKDFLIGGWHVYTHLAAVGLPVLCILCVADRYNFPPELDQSQAVEDLTNEANFQEDRVSVLERRLAASQLEVSQLKEKLQPPKHRSNEPFEPK